jgi:hypothetical protein
MNQDPDIVKPSDSGESRRLKRWALLSLINLFIVSILGVMLRWKAAFSMPLVNYKYLLNAHSHFAFSGWVTTVLFVSLLYIYIRSGGRWSKVYSWQFWLNQVSSFGMLFSFIWQGYGPVSIFFSALSVVFSYWFAFQYWKDIRRTDWPLVVKVCGGLALFFLILSSAGPFLLAYSMSHGVGNMAFYYNSIYLYLHFQYNGWFTFGLMTIFFWSANQYGLMSLIPGKKAPMRFVVLMGIACIPAYCLSLLWTDPPVSVHVVAGAAALLQCFALVLLGRWIWRGRETWRRHLSGSVGFLWGLSLASFTIKICLQAMSVVPSLGRLAFGYRPVIIAYLHLVVLGFVSLFLIGFLVMVRLFSLRTVMSRAGIACFIAGVVGNEAILLVQSLMAMGGHAWSSCPYYLLGAAFLLFTGLGLLVMGAAPIASSVHTRQKMPASVLPYNRRWLH